MSMPTTDRLQRAALRFRIAMAEEVLRQSPDDTEALRTLSHAYAVDGRLDAALATDRHLVDCLPGDVRARYNLACRLALHGRTDEALRELDVACELGFDDVDLLAADPDLRSLHAEESFRALRARLARGRDD